MRLRDVADQLAHRMRPVNTLLTIEDNDIILTPNFRTTAKTQRELDGSSYVVIQP